MKIRKYYLWHGYNWWAAFQIIGFLWKVDVTNYEVTSSFEFIYELIHCIFGIRNFNFEFQTGILCFYFRNEYIGIYSILFILK